jgi:uncharacterized protein
LNNQIDIDKSSLRVIVTLGDVTSNEVIAIDQKAQQWLRDNAPQVMFAEGTGLAMMYAHLSERNIKSMLTGTFVMMALISFLLIFAFRSLKFGLLSLAPNILPLFMAFGIWGYTASRIGVAASVLLSVAGGLVVDDTIHFITKYLHARRHEGKSPEEAVRHTFINVGPAMVITSIALVAGFSTLLLSGFKPNTDMGAMTSIIISLALLFDMIFVPAMLLLTDKATVAVKETRDAPTHPELTKLPELAETA